MNFFTQNKRNVQPQQNFPKIFHTSWYARNSYPLIFVAREKIKGRKISKGKRSLKYRLNEAA